MENSKITYVRQVEDLATQLAATLHKVEDFQKIWDSRLYGPGMENQFTDAELAVLDSLGYRSCTADELYAFVIFCAQFQKFMSNEAPAVSNYSATINKIRTDI